MRFINYRHADWQPGKGLAKVVEGEAFGGDVEQIEVMCIEVTHHLVALLPTLGAVEKGGTNAVGPCAVHLVFHQGNQRTDYHADAWQQQGRELVAE